MVPCLDHSTLWRILKEMRVLDHLTCLLRSLYAVQEATVRTGDETTDWFQNRKRSTYIKAVCCHPAYLTSMQSTSCEMPGWMKPKLESRLPGEISITLDMHMTPPLWQKSEELKSFLMTVKEESEKVGLKLNIQKMKIMTSSPITSWQIDGETMETVRDLILGAPKLLQIVTAAMK